MLKRQERDEANSCWNKAGDEEPVFVLRAKDPASSAAIRAWCDERVRLGMNNRLDEKIIEAMVSAGWHSSWRSLQDENATGEPFPGNSAAITNATPTIRSASLYTEHETMCSVSISSALLVQQGAEVHLTHDPFAEPQKPLYDSASKQVSYRDLRKSFFNTVQARPDVEWKFFTCVSLEKFCDECPPSVTPHVVGVPDTYRGTYVKISRRS